jgi:hypothetical protein
LFEETAVGRRPETVRVANVRTPASARRGGQKVADAITF